MAELFFICTVRMHVRFSSCALLVTDIQESNPRIVSYCLTVIRTVPQARKKAMILCHFSRRCARRFVVPWKQCPAYRIQISLLSMDLDEEIISSSLSDFLSAMSSTAKLSFYSSPSTAMTASSQSNLSTCSETFKPPRLCPTEISSAPHGWSPVLPGIPSLCFYLKPLLLRQSLRGMMDHQ
jgi:hypothetical protein